VLPFKLDLPPWRGGNARRRARRPAKGLSLTCTRPALSRLHAGRNLALELQDVGSGGVRFVASEPLPVPCPLELQIRKEDSGEVLHARGEIAWVKSRNLNGREVHVVGVKFDEVQTPPEACARFFESRAVTPLDAPPRRRVAGRFRITDCEVTLVRNERSRAPENPANLASKLLDLSRTGAQVACTESLTRGERVRLTLRLEKLNDTFTAEAEAAWVRHAGLSGGGCKAGLAFGSLDHAQQRKLQSLESWFCGKPDLRPPSA
jgi:hypothetical protein